MASQSSQPSPDFIWKNYELHVNLLTTYLELVLKFNIFYYAVTGGLLSYYFAKENMPLMQYALVFPVVMSLLFAIFFWYAAKRSALSRQLVDELGHALGFKIIPEYHVLTWILRLCAVLFGAIGLIIGGLFVY